MSLALLDLCHFMNWLSKVACPCSTLYNLRLETCFLLNFYIMVYSDFTKDLSRQGRFYNHNVDDLKLNFRFIWNYESPGLEYLLMASVPLFWRRQWHPTPVLLPRKSHGWRSLEGCSPEDWSLRVGHDLATSLSLFTFMHWRRKWQPTPVFLPGESQGRESLVGCRLWGCTESDTTEAT